MNTIQNQELFTNLNAAESDEVNGRIYIHRRP